MVKKKFEQKFTEGATEVAGNVKGGGHHEQMAHHTSRKVQAGRRQQPLERMWRTGDPTARPGAWGDVLTASSEAKLIMRPGICPKDMKTHIHTKTPPQGHNINVRRLANEG